MHAEFILAKFNKCWILFPLRQKYSPPLNFKSTINAQDQLKIKKFSTTKSGNLKPFPKGIDIVELNFDSKFLRRVRFRQ